LEVENKDTERRTQSKSRTIKIRKKRKESKCKCKWRNSAELQKQERFSEGGAFRACMQKQNSWVFALAAGTTLQISLPPSLS
jgi:hypothetical protein